MRNKFPPLKISYLQMHQNIVNYAKGRVRSVFCSQTPRSRLRDI